MEITEKKSRGGKRPGSGRKPRDTVQLTIRISAEADRRLREILCKGSHPGQIIEALILKASKRIASA
jgi:hypothetical protein